MDKQKQTHSSNELEITKAVAGLFAAFGQSGDVNRVNIYTLMLQDFPSEIVKKACRKVILECKFLPTVAEIVAAIKSLAGTADENIRAKTWEEAWREIERAMFDTPWGKTPTFSTPEIAAAVSAFDWNSLQTSLAADMSTVRAQVRRFYEDACKRISEKQRNDYVMGKEPVTVLIGYGNGKRKGSLNIASEIMELLKDGDFR